MKPYWISIIVLAACNDVAVQEATPSSANIDVAQAVGYEVSTEDQDASGAQVNRVPEAPSSNGGSLDNSAVAIEPVPIGGAYLTCQLSIDLITEASCYVLAKDGGDFPFNAKSAYTIVKDEDTWTPVAFRPDPNRSNAWFFSLPFNGNERSFVVIVADENSNVLADWVLQKDKAPLTLVADGDFELNRIDPTKQETTQYVPPERQDKWKARNSDPNSKCIPVVEMQDITNAASEKDAVTGQWVELDSSCTTDWQSGGNNIAIFQDLTLEAGKLYEISFVYKGRRGAKGPQALKVSLGGDVILSQVPSDEQWISYRSLFVAKDSKVRLDFEESGFVDGRGTLIDNVAVRDLGNGAVAATSP